MAIKKNYFGCVLRKLSNVGPDLPKGSSGGIKRSFTNEYIRPRSPTTFLKIGFSDTKSR